MSNTKVSTFFPGTTHSSFGYPSFSQKQTANSIEEIFQQDTFDILNMMVPNFDSQQNEIDSQQTLTNDSFPLTGSKRTSSSAPKNEKKSTKRRKTSQDQSSSPYNSDEDDVNSTTDEKKLKRQKRLVKNREAAQLFRQRQKNYIQDLEKKVEGLNAENHQFTSKAELLESENRLLRDQLTYLRGFLSQIMTMAFPVQSSFNFPALLGPNGTSISSNAESGTTSSAMPGSSSSVNLGQQIESSTSASSASNNQTSEANPAHSVAAAFQAAMGFSNPNTQSHSSK